MKLVLIAYNEAVDDEVMGVLAGLGADTFTKWTKVLGHGKSSGPHLSSHVWPKANNVLAACVDDETAPPLFEALRALRAEVSRQGLKAFLLPVEDVTD